MKPLLPGSVLLNSNLVKMGAPEKQTFGQKCHSQWAGFSNFLYRKSDKGETLVMGRTGRSWAKIGLFYLVFYGFLAAFFVAMLSVFLSTINKPEDGGPKLTQFIKNQPGLTRLESKDRPLPENFIASNTTENKKYAEFITEFLEGYDNNETYTNEFCDVTKTKGTPAGKKPCRFDYMTHLGECSNSSNLYGLQVGKPCVFVKINKVYDWVPDVTGQFLKMTCDQGAKVFPDGFLLAAFPFRNQKNFQLPVVAIQVDLTSTLEKTVICKLEGDGIEVSSSVVPSRAYGKIRLDDLKRKN